MVTVHDVLQWDPEELSAVADELSRDRKALVGLDDELHDAKPPASWVGADSVVAEQAHVVLADDLVDGVAEVASVITALDAAAVEVRTAKRDLEEALTRARSLGFEVNHSTGVVTDPNSYENRFLHEEARVRARGVAQDVSAALQAAEQADADLAAILTKADKGRIDAHGDLGDLSLLKELSRMSVKEQAKYLLEHPDRAVLVLPMVGRKVKQAVGRQLARLTDDLTEPDKLPLSTPEDAEEWLAELNDKFDALEGDPVVATSFLNEMTPEKLLEVSGYLARLQRDDDYPDGEPDRHHVDGDLSIQMGELQSNLGSILDAGTDGIEHGGESGTPSNVSPEWVRKLVEAGDDVLPVGSQGEDGSRPVTAYGYQLLGPLLRSVESHYLLTEVGDGMIEFETEFATENKGELPWPHPIRDGHGDIIGGRNDGSGVSARFDGLRFDWTGGHGEGDPAGYDPMGALLEGLSHNPDAARDFFTGDGVPVMHFDGPASDPSAVSSAETTSRTDYLVTDRAWPHDHPNWSGVAEHDRYGPNQSEFLGDAIRAATTDEPTEVESRHQVRDIVEEMVRAIGQDEAREGKLPQYDGDEVTESAKTAPWMPPGIREDVAAILGHHADAVLGSREMDFDSGGPEGRYGIRLKLAHIDDVLTDLGKDPESHGIVNAAVTEEAVSQSLRHPEHSSDIGESLAEVYQKTGDGHDAMYEARRAAEDAAANDEVGRKADTVRGAGNAAEFVLGKFPATRGIAGGASLITEAMADILEERGHVDSTGRVEAEIRKLDAHREAVAALVIANALARNS